MIKILGTSVACVTYGSVLEIVQELTREPWPTAVCPANTHILSEARHEPEFAQGVVESVLISWKSKR